MGKPHIVRKRTNPRAKYAASVIVSYLLSFVLLLLVTASVLRGTLFSADYHAERLEKSSFAEIAAQELEQEYVSFASSAGVSSGILTAKLTPSIVNTAAKASLRHMFKVGSAYDYSKYKDMLFQALITYAEAEGHLITDELSEGLVELAGICAEAFEMHTRSKLYETAVPYVLRFTGALNAAISALSGLVFLLTIALFILNRRRISRFAHCISCSLAAAALSCVVIAAVVRASGVFTRLNITPQSYNNLIANVLDGVMGGYLIAVLAFVPPLLISLAVWHIRRRKRGYKRKVAEAVKET